MFELIDDGFTLVEKIPALAWWGAFEVTYRPALPDAVTAYLRRSGSATDAGPMADFVAAHVVSWTVPTDKKPVADVLRRVPHAVLRELADRVASYGPAQWEAAGKN